MARNEPLGSRKSEGVDPAKKLDNLMGTPTSPDDIAKEQKIEGPETAVAPMLGGSPGVIPDVTRDAPMESRFRVRGEVVKTKQYRVTQGGHIMLEGVRVPIRLGKVLDDTMYDLDKLTSQGVRLEEIVEPKE